MEKTAGDLKEALKDTSDDAPLLFSVDVSTKHEDTHMNRLNSDFVEIGIEHDIYDAPGTRVILSLFEMDKNFDDSALSDLLKVVDAAFEYIDAIPKDTELPAMPGLDRDWANGVIIEARKLITGE